MSRLELQLLVLASFCLLFLSTVYGRQETRSVRLGATSRTIRRVIVDLVGGSSLPGGKEDKEGEVPGGKESKEEDEKQEVEGEKEKREETAKAAVVVDVTVANFRREVLESDTPVLLDVYADWCGPCKQLTPVLEKVAIASKGQFRLAKLNSDENQELVGILNVTGLPTCFAVNEGTLTDKFMGGLPPGMDPTEAQP